jgi:excisionase family DNA binding protein
MKNPAEGDKLLSARAVAELLSLHPLTVYLMAKQGRLPAIKLGRIVRFKKSEIEKLMQRNIIR